MTDLYQKRFRCSIVMSPLWEIWATRLVTQTFCKCHRSYCFYANYVYMKTDGLLQLTFSRNSLDLNPNKLWISIVNTWFTIRRDKTFCTFSWNIHDVDLSLFVHQNAVEETVEAETTDTRSDVYFCCQNMVSELPNHKWLSIMHWCPCSGSGWVDKLSVSLNNGILNLFWSSISSAVKPACVCSA